MGKIYQALLQFPKVDNNRKFNNSNSFKIFKNNISSGDGKRA